MEDSPFVRYGWLMWGVWLVFLVFPTIAALGQDTWPAVTGGLAAVVIFALLYIAAFRGLWGTGATSWIRPELMLLALSGVAVLAALAIGADALSFTPFLVSFGMFGLRRPLNWVWALALVASTVALPQVVGADRADEGLVFSLVAVSLGTGIGRLMSDLGESHAAVRDQLTVTAERDRVARDVHDVLGHSLTVVSVKAELAERLVDLDPERARAELVEIQTLTRQALAEIRSTVGGLRAAVLTDEIAAAGVALGAAGIAADLPDNHDVLDPRRRSVAAWVLREAVTNVVRHSGARRCTVTLAPDRLVVHDDGRGIAAGACGNGLRGVRERVAETGGTLVVGPDATGGTTVEVSW